MRQRFLVIVILFILSCMSAVEKRKKEIAENLDPLIGKTVEEIVLTIGPPTEIKQTGEIEIYQYYTHYGTKTISKYIPAKKYTKAKTKTAEWESYDLINVYFYDGKMIKWNCEVRR